jgi:hypothetical protein
MIRRAALGVLAGMLGLFWASPADADGCASCVGGASVPAGCYHTCQRKPPIVKNALCAFTRRMLWRDGPYPGTCPNDLQKFQCKTYYERVADYYEDVADYVEAHKKMIGSHRCCNTPCSYPLPGGMLGGGHGGGHWAEASAGMYGPYVVQNGTYVTQTARYVETVGRHGELMR